MMVIWASKQTRIPPKAMSRLGRIMCQGHVIATFTANEFLISAHPKFAKMILGFRVIERIQFAY